MGINSTCIKNIPADITHFLKEQTLREWVKLEKKNWAWVGRGREAQQGVLGEAWI